MNKKLTHEEVVCKRHTLSRCLELAAEEYRNAQALHEKQLYELQADCPHKARTRYTPSQYEGGGSVCNWCGKEFR